jgi:hypothetical protein
MSITTSAVARALLAAPKTVAAVPVTAAPIARIFSTAGARDPRGYEQLHRAVSVSRENPVSLQGAHRVSPALLNTECLTAKSNKSKKFYPYIYLLYYHLSSILLSFIYTISYSSVTYSSRLYPASFPARIGAGFASNMIRKGMKTR